MPSDRVFSERFDANRIHDGGIPDGNRGNAELVVRVGGGRNARDGGGDEESGLGLDAAHVEGRRENACEGNVGLLRVSDWENVLGEDGIQFAEGACVSSVETGSGRAFCLVLENPREWMRDLEGGHVIANAYALQSIEEVTPWEKFVRCIRSKEFGTALQLAKRLHFDEDLV